MKKHIFDLDNTLVYTDLLNNKSYNYALNKHGLSSISSQDRITRDIVFNKYINLNSKDRNKIIKLKQNYFLNNLQETIPNTSLVQILKDKDPQLCMLWTSADKVRALKILEYYNILDSFKEFLFSNKANLRKDVKEICRILGSEP